MPIVKIGLFQSHKNEKNILGAFVLALFHPFAVTGKQLFRQKSLIPRHG